MRLWMWIVALLVCISISAQAQCVKVKYYAGDCIDLAQFRCTDTKSSFVHQVCYDAAKSFMVILLNKTRYPYCGIPEASVGALIKADLVGTYYNKSVKGNFDCRVTRAPQYPACAC